MRNTPFAVLTGITRSAVFVAILLGAPNANAITGGEHDCADNANNIDCRHPNTASISGFKNGVSFVQCSGTLLAENSDRFVILTAGHCVKAYLNQLATGGIDTVGISFDAEVTKDLPEYGPHHWSTNQFILGGQPVLPIEWGPTGNSWVHNFDYGVIAFELPEDFRVNGMGNPVNIGAIAPVVLPEQDFLKDLVSGSDPILVTTVGYGTGAYLNGPGEGGNFWGPTPDFEKVGVRWMTEDTLAFSFQGYEQNFLFTSQNPARDYEGSCDGDSGGPIFYEEGGTQIQVGIASWGEVWCRATASNARTDSARAVDFLACVTTGATAQIDDILACGCTELSDQGACPR